MRTMILAAIAAAMSASGAIAVAQQGPGVTVVVNGSPVRFDQPPVERGGRVFVPLRGVFEQLGASVVFANGTINATSGAHTIALTLGSQQATVDGRPTVLDSPPFLIGARTLVPLRFISQALGATVNFDGAQETVYVALQRTASGPPRVLPEPIPVAERLLREEPAAHTSIDRKRPEVSAAFARPVRLGSIHVTLDDRDVTADAYVSDRTFVFTPAYDLPSGPHVVAVRGRAVDGPPFTAEWTFASNAVENPNSIDDLSLANGDHVGPHFTIRGRTQPNAHVRILATTNAQIEHFSGEVTSGAQRADVVAGEHGFFQATFDIDGAPGPDEIDLRIVSTAPDASVAVRTLRLRS